VSNTMPIAFPRRPWLPLLSLAGLTAAACQAPPQAPEHPTWADVAPILQGECNHCHGATARTTGSDGPATYRFDFFDVDDAVCGDAALAMDLPALAVASAKLIKTDIATPMYGRPRMPPAPAAVLQDWERETIERWADQPVKGPPPPGNRRPRIAINQLASASVKGQLSFIATVDDPDADSVIGIVRLGDRVFKMDHPGTFSVKLDLTGMPAGTQRLSAVLCDGWGNADYDLGPVQVKN
jgi:hypothetical protein